MSEFDIWLDTDMGKVLLAVESQKIEQLLPGRYFKNVVQFGMPAYSIMDNVTAKSRSTVDFSTRRGANVSVVSDFKSLPFGAHSVDLAILPHSLDYVENPHNFLRELTQIMVPDGTVLLTGFQPFSLWGISKVMHVLRPKSPWAGRFLTTGRVQDWLSLMGYRIQAGGMTMYRPPIARGEVFRKLEFLESAGDRWWPMLGAVYVIVARLETIGVVPVSRMPIRRAFTPSMVQVRRLSASQRSKSDVERK